MVSCSQCCYKVPNYQNFNFPSPKTKEKENTPPTLSPPPPFFGTPPNWNSIKSTAQLKRLKKKKKKTPPIVPCVPFLDLTSRVLWQLTWRRRLSVKRRRQPKSLQHLDFGIWIAGPQTVGNRRRLDRDLNHGSRNGWKLTSLLQHVEWDLNLGVPARVGNWRHCYNPSIPGSQSLVT